MSVKQKLLQVTTVLFHAPASVNILVYKEITHSVFGT